MACAMIMEPLQFVHVPPSRFEIQIEGIATRHRGQLAVRSFKFHVGRSCNATSLATSFSYDSELVEISHCSGIASPKKAATLEEGF